MLLPTVYVSCELATFLRPTILQPDCGQCSQLLCGTVQVCAEVAIVILDENTPASRSWFTWRDILHLVDIICCCAILFPIVWSIKHLREAAGVSA